ncbi:MAG TPA: hypothetical protein VF553_14255 [Pyrinomonadaceae bacterium]|jgi:hypothetical protein
MKKRHAARLIVLILSALLSTLIVPGGYRLNAGPTLATIRTAKDEASATVPFRLINSPLLSPQKLVAKASLTRGEQRPAAPSRPDRCPQLVIACPLYIVEQDTQLRFSALVAGQDSGAALSYTWSLAGGTINAGQGTPTITADTTGLGGRRVVATVAVSGLAAECQSVATCAIYVARPKEARLLDSYGDLAFDLEKARLAVFATELKNKPDLQGYIVVYGGRCGAETQAQERAERAKDWLINEHGIEASHIVAIDGGARETTTTEIFVGPIDATLPELAATTTGPLDNSRCK